MCPFTDSVSFNRFALRLAEGLEVLGESSARNEDPKHVGEKLPEVRERHPLSRRLVNWCAA